LGDLKNANILLEKSGQYCLAGPHHFFKPKKKEKNVEINNVILVRSVFYSPNESSGFFNYDFLMKMKLKKD
jgi:hypothetical protein